MVGGGWVVVAAGWLSSAEEDGTDPSPGTLTSDTWHTPLVAVHGTHILGVDEYIVDRSVKMHDYRVARVGEVRGYVKVGDAEC